VRLGQLLALFTQSASIFAPNLFFSVPTGLYG